MIGIFVRIIFWIIFIISVTYIIMYIKDVRKGKKQGTFDILLLIGFSSDIIGSIIFLIIYYFFGLNFL